MKKLGISLLVLLSWNILTLAAEEMNPEIIPNSPGTFTEEKQDSNSVKSDGAAVTEPDPQLDRLNVLNAPELKLRQGDTLSGVNPPPVESK